MHLQIAIVIAISLLASPAASLDAQSINDAQWSAKTHAKGAIVPALVKAQVLLDRARFSPGEIDGKLGENIKKAVAAFATAQGLPAPDGLTEEVWQKLVAGSQAPVLKEYTVGEEDVRGPFIDKMPPKMEMMQDLPALGYVSAREKIAERFHMSPELLTALNPGRTFATAGESIVVANVATSELPEKAARIEVDKSAQTLRVYGRAQRLLAFYPVTVGSVEKPAPSGRVKVTAVNRNPTYRYNPDYAFKGVKSREPFTIKPGPNNPVGLVWIGLSEDGYGIHGTPEPSKISKSESNGCTRMTNWDALQLAAHVSKGTPVDFIGAEEARRARAEVPLRNKRR
jgi:lipoprotein-anchoring transpeptidase ErfK/SrfK